MVQCLAEAARSRPACPRALLIVYSISIDLLFSDLTILHCETDPAPGPEILAADKEPQVWTLEHIKAG